MADRKTIENTPKAQLTYYERSLKKSLLELVAAVGQTTSNDQGLTIDIHDLNTLSTAHTRHQQKKKCSHH